MSTVGALIEETRAHLQGFHKPSLNRLSGSLDASTTSVTVEFTTDPVARGSVICVDDELMYVWSVSGATLTVQRGYLGSTAATHASLALVEINPRHSTPQIRAELKKEIASWGTRIWNVVELELAVGVNARSVELTGAPANFLHVLGVRRPATASEYAPRELQYRYERNYGDESLLILNAFLPEAQTISVLYATPFDLSSFGDSVDLVDDIGVPASALDIPPLGAAWRLVATREVSRNEISAAPEPRVAADVPPQSIRDDRIGEEARLLQHKFGLRRP
jgi:hypothetical protein